MSTWINPPITNIHIYELTRDYSNLAGVPLPGTRGVSTIPAPDGGLKTFAAGLTLQELQNGELIYTEETVTYVANLMMIDESWKTEAFLETLGENDCRWFLKKIEAIQKKAAGIVEEEPTEPETTEDTTEDTTEGTTEGSTEGGETEETPKTPEQLRAEALGSMEDTISKTIPFVLNGVEDRRNGGVLLSKDCKTAFDLAYYALNNLWRPVGEADVLDDGNEATTDYHYNTIVPERARLRMYWDPAVGMYTFDASNQVIYNGAYIYNSLPLKPTPVPYNLPRFMPIDGLGFEKPEIDENGVEKKSETDRSTYLSEQGFGTDYEDLNYHYALHASGSFAYYEDQELYFSFLGDDDVYFFIDGKMVMDLGGAHQAAGTDFSLNRESLVKKGLDLKDGEIYSFDMFYAERHSSGSNMRFSTNMHIMDTQTVTTKGQYLVESDGQSSVNPSTGMGKSLPEGAVMNIGDTVAYGFDLLNIREVAIEELSFTDDSLGTDISPDGICLTNPELTNGALTGIEDISLYYRSYDPVTKKLNVDALQSYTASEMLFMIESLKTGNGKDQPLPSGSYWVTLDAETGVADLINLLAAGVLPMCQLTVYGFRRTMVEGDVPYVNTVVSNCNFKRTENSLVGMQQERISITGSASRTLRVPDVDGLVKPVAQKVQIVLDYGKPIQIPIASLKEKIYVVDPVTVGDYLGLITVDPNDTTCRELPETPLCGKDGDTLIGNSGNFTRKGDVLEYRLSKMMSSMERVLAVFALNNYSVSAGSQSKVHPYVVVELQLIPATSMYYETDFVKDYFVTEAVGTTETWSTEGTEAETGKYQNNGYEKDQYPTEATGTAVEDVAMQELSPTSKKSSTRSTALSGDYVLLDFDTNEVEWTGVHMTALTDTTNGILYGELSGSDPHINMDLSKSELSYTLEKGDQIQLRLNANINLGHPWGYKVYLLIEGESAYTETYAFSSDVVYVMGKWQIFTLDIPDAHAGKRVRALRLDPMHCSTEGADCIGTYQVDYIYLGGRDTLPYQEAMFFDFVNDTEMPTRYTTRSYKGINYDLPASWECDYSGGTIAQKSVNEAESALVIQTTKDESKTGKRIYVRTPIGNIDFHPSEANILQIRMKLEDFSGSSPFFRLWWWGTKDGKNYRGYENHYSFGRNFSSDGTYVTYTMDLHSVLDPDGYNDSANFNGYIDMRELDTVTSLHLGIHNFDEALAPQVSIDYLYVGPRGGEPQQDALYFDFTNTSEDKERYNNKTYEGHNYDEGNWVGSWRGNAWTAATIADGAITMGMTDYSYGYVQTVDNDTGNLYYVPKKAETVAIRFKFSEEIGLTSSSYAYFKFRVIKDGSVELAHEQTIPIPENAKVYDGYVTLVADITNAEIRNADFFNSLRVGFSDLTKSNGTMTIDYIYVGPRSGVPSEDQLLFHFTNTAEDQKRYNSNTYGYRYNYDTDMDKWIAPYGLEKLVENGNEGSITVKGTASSGGSYIETTDGNQSYLTMPLNYRPSAGDMVQIRFKLNGIKTETGRNVCLYFGRDEDYIRVGTQNYHVLRALKESDFSGEYVVITAALPEKFTSAQRISTVRAAFNGINSEDPANPGSVTVDYIYVGPERDLPTPRYTVTYQNEAGTVLETQVVHEGEASVYHGATPTKTHTANIHYFHSGWVTTAGATVDLNNITSDLTLKPTFRSENHKWNNTTIQELSCTTNKVIHAVCSVCPCTNTYVSQYATGHSFVDGKCTVCGIGNTGTLLHFLKDSPETGFKWESLKQTTKPTFQTAEPGYMTGSYNKAGAAECYVGMTATNPMDNIAHKVSSPDEIIQVRMKLTMSQQLALATNSYRVYLNTSDMATNSTYDTAHGVGPYSVSEDQEGYTILSFPMPLLVVGNTIEAIRLDFLRGMADVTGVSGTYSVDYIYFGHCCKAPVPQHAWNSGEITEAPTCKDTGIRSHVCFYCGAPHETVIPMGEHYYAPGKTTAPTCSTVGYKGGSFCVGCGIPQVVDGVEQVAEVIPMIDHSYSYTQISDSEHQMDCMFCDHSYTEAHIYYYGQCRCGAYEPEHMIYGYDPSYLDDNALSNGTSLFVKGAGVTIKNEEGATSDTYTRATFSFTGTGFDLISRTGVEQATIRVVVYSDKEMTEDNREKSITVNNKGELELYQIPVASIHDLPYGTYYVAIGVNKEINYKPEEGKPDMSFLNRGNEFYFDAVRIYDPLNTATDTDTLSVYKTHGEAYPLITEVRELLLTAEQFSTAGTNTSGMVFIDASKDNGGSSYTANVTTYKEIGPKNETYLSGGRAVSFKLLVEGKVLPKSLDIGAKTIYGGKAVLCAGIGKAEPTENIVTSQMTKTERSITSATSLYYSLSLQESDFQVDNNGDYYAYVVLSNSGAAANENVLSITDIKAAFDTDPSVVPSRSASPAVRYVVDGDTFRVAEAFLTGTMAELPVDDGAVIRHSLDLASDISINYVVEKKAMADYDSIRLQCSLPKYEGTKLMGYEELWLEPTEKGEYYYFTLAGLTAVQMNDEIKATLHMEKDGWSHVSQTDVYSVGTYAYSQLSKQNTSEELKSLCAELLRYGAMAQTYKSYRTNALVDAVMTEEQKSLLRNLDTVSFGSNNQVLEDCAAPSVKWVGKALSLDSKVTVKYVIDLSDYKGTEPLSLRISYKDYKGQQQCAVLRTLSPYQKEKGYYSFSFDGLLAAELRTVLTAAVYAGNEQVSHSLVYSPDTYGNNKTGTLLQLCKALFAYSDSARNFFGAS